MSDEQGPYSRVYWSIRADDRFRGIYTDNNHLATWLRLLMAADAVWPAPADLPRSARQASINALAEAGLLELIEPGDLYRIHGLDAERERRASAGKAGASARWMRSQSERNAVALPPQSDRNASRAKPRQDEPSIAREGLPNLNSAVATFWEQATGRTILASGNYAAEYLDDACRRHAPSEVGAAVLRARKNFDHIPDAAQMVAAMRPILDPLPDRAAVKATDDGEKRNAAAKRQMQLTKHSGGYHIDAVDPDCPKCQKGAA